ncbi:hypothetical protein ACJMK2_041526 [Sinanodonta woodiana]|uniref:Proteasome assembly chaperone 3 n=1 Tax=Sinanodonta woodiana TaxID=1069815 RepID=A0ABD3W4G6_SINWO
MAAPKEDVRDSSTSFPVKNNCIAVEVNSHKTELVCCTFEDRIFCIVTQYQKLGMLVDVTREIVMEETDTAPPRYSTRVLLGKDEPMTHVLAQTLISKLDIHKPIILAMALKDTAPSSVKKLAEYLTQLVNT